MKFQNQNVTMYNWIPHTYSYYAILLFLCTATVPASGEASGAPQTDSQTGAQGNAGPGGVWCSDHLTHYELHSTP